MRLTRRESEVSACLMRGLHNKHISRELEISVATVKHHVHNILLKSGHTCRRQYALAQKRPHVWFAGGQWWCGVRASGQTPQAAHQAFTGAPG